MSAALIPALLFAVGVWGLYKKTDIFSCLTSGCRKGFETIFGIAPALIALMPAIYMLRASGAPEALAELLSPLLGALGIPAETVPLMLLRPFSGSGALAIGSELISAHGPDSFVGRCAAVMLGSTETTFYVIATYFGACGIKKTRHAIPSALAADLAGFIAACITVRLFF